MIRAVVGIGPRVGSSFVMQSIRDAGIPIYWDTHIEAVLPSEGNPGGYFETNPKDFPSLKDVVCKVWPISAGTADIERMVILERDRETQLHSIQLQMDRERELLEIVGLDWTPEDFLTKSLAALQPLLSTPHLRVRTEDLNDRIAEIIQFMRY